MLLSQGGGVPVEVAHPADRELILRALCQAEGRAAIWLDQHFDLLVFGPDDEPVVGLRCWTTGSGLAALELEPEWAGRRLSDPQSWRVRDYRYDGLRIEIPARDLQQMLAASAGQASP